MLSTAKSYENKLSELWSIFDYLMPELLESYPKFRKQYELPIVKDKDENAKAHLSNTVMPFICLLYTSPSPRDPKTSRMPSSA